MSSLERSQTKSLNFNQSNPECTHPGGTPGLEDSKVNRLKWILRHTMGSPAAFEHRRHELILETPGASAGPVVSDAEVLGSFLKSVEPGESTFSSLKRR